MGNLSSLLLFGVFFLLLFNCLSNSITAIDFKVDRSLDFSEILSTSYRGVKPLKLEGFQVKWYAQNLVMEISFNATYLAIGGVRATDLPYSDLIIAYLLKVGGTPRKPKLQPTVMRIPYSSQPTPSTPRWYVGAVYNDVIDPLDMSESGAWNSGETILLVVDFPNDIKVAPYFNPDAGLGYFYILLDLPSGERGVMAVK